MKYGRESRGNRRDKLLWEQIGFTSEQAEHCGSTWSNGTIVRQRWISCTNVITHPCSGCCKNYSWKSVRIPQMNKNSRSFVPFPIRLRITLIIINQRRRRRTVIRIFILWVMHCWEYGSRHVGHLFECCSLFRRHEQRMCRWNISIHQPHHRTRRRRKQISLAHNRGGGEELRPAHLRGREDRGGLQRKVWGISILRWEQYYSFNSMTRQCVWCGDHSTHAFIIIHVHVWSIVMSEMIFI